MFMSPNAIKTDTSFQKWFERWITKNEAGWTAKTLAERMELVPSTVSHWRTGKHVPDPRQLFMLHEISGESLYHLAHLAYGWPAVPSTDPMQKEPMLREVAVHLVQLYRRAPERMPLVVELVRGVLRDSKRLQETGTDDG